MKIVNVHNILSKEEKNYLLLKLIEEKGELHPDCVNLRKSCEAMKPPKIDRRKAYADKLENPPKKPPKWNGMTDNLIHVGLTYLVRYRGELYRGTIITKTESFRNGKGNRNCRVKYSFRVINTELIDYRLKLNKIHFVSQIVK